MQEIELNHDLEAIETSTAEADKFRLEHGANVCTSKAVLYSADVASRSIFGPMATRLSLSSRKAQRCAVLQRTRLRSAHTLSHTDPRAEGCALRSPCSWSNPDWLERQSLWHPRRHHCSSRSHIALGTCLRCRSAYDGRHHRPLRAVQIRSSFRGRICARFWHGWHGEVMLLNILLTAY